MNERTKPLSFYEELPRAGNNHIHREYVVLVDRPAAVASGGNSDAIRRKSSDRTEEGKGGNSLWPLTLARALKIVSH